MSDPVSITGTASNVQINNADLHVTNTSKKIIAPRAELSAISGIALTTSSNVGLVNTAPIHTLDVGSKFFVDETGATTVRVRGLLEADTINFGGSTADRVFVSNSDGALSTDDGLQYNSSTNALTLAGAFDANSTADIADTLTLSKGSGVALEVSSGGATNLKALTANNTTVVGTLGVTEATTMSDDLTVRSGKLSVTSEGISTDGTLDVSGASTLTTISSNAITARGSLVVVNNDGTNNLIISAANGTSSVSGNFGVGGLATLNAGLKMTSGDSLLKDLYANATTITDGLTVSSGTTAVQALTATTGDFTGAVGVDGNFDVNTDKFTVASASGNTVIAGDLDVRTDKLSVSATGVSTSGTLSVTGTTTLTGALDANSSADIADTLTLSKGSGVALVVSTGGATHLKGLVANATTITDGLTVSSGTTAVQALTATTGGFTGAVGIDGDFDVNTDKFTVAASTGNTVIAGSIDANSTADIADTLTLSKGSGVALEVSTGGATHLKGLVANATTITNGITVSGGATVSDSGLTVTAGGLTVSAGTTAVQALTATTGDFTGAVGVDGNFDVATNKFTVDASTGNTVIAGSLDSGAATLASASITGAGNALTVTNNAVISGQMRADSGLIDNNLQVGGNLIVDGELTVLQTNNLVVDDPLIELGNTNTNSGAIIDVGMVFRQPSGNSNVVTFYDGSDSKYRIGLTTNGAYDSAITTTGNIEVEVTGNVTVTNTIKAPALELDGSSIRIEGNSIVFG